MQIKILRLSSTKKSTIGTMFIDGEFECFTLEDPKQIVKIYGETRIPCGVYEIDFANDGTDLTEKYKKKYDYFDRHIEIKNVNNFTSVYIHVGNKTKDTKGCILVGNKVINNKIYDKDNSFLLVEKSEEAFKYMYKKIRQALIKKEKVIIDIIDYA